MLSIQTNVNSINAQENLRVTNEFQARTIARLTSGYRINQSGDDAAGLAVANKFRSDIAELTQGVRNANDGLSTMQIIDGGLSNISRMLDRLKTLATQSASSTFEGNRATLNNEYTSLLSEIDRQAANIGLGSGSSASARYNKQLAVYIGGSVPGSSAAVNINLSASTDLVNSMGLGIASTNILAGGAVAQGSSATNLNTATNILSANSTQQFRVNVESQSMLITVTGTGTGLSGTDVLNQINNQVSALGISASINNSTGGLEWVSSKAFTVQALAKSGTGAGITSAADATTVNTAKYRVAGSATGGFQAIGAGNTETFTVTVGTQVATVSLNEYNGADVDSAVSAINQQLGNIGVVAVKSATSAGVMFMSDSNFAISDDTGSAGDEGVIKKGTAPAAPTAPTSSSNSTANATVAIAALNSAVSNLGVVQGKIGTAQNRLSYAIQLAQSQITNFSAAESRIRDAEIAQEAANLTKAQVLSQASMAALAQANSAPQAVLSLLRG